MTAPRAQGGEGLSGHAGKSTALLIAFDSTHAALSAQSLLGGLSITLIPTPREISAGCGMSLLVAASDADAARRLVEDKPSIRALCAFYGNAGGSYRPL